MRALMGLVVGLTMIAGSAHAEWRMTGMGHSGYSAVNKSNIMNTGGLKRAWVVMVPRSPKPGAYILIRFTYNCQEATQSQTDWFVYDAQGKTIEINRVTTPFSSVMPDSLFESNYKAVCENVWEEGNPTFETTSEIYEFHEKYFSVMDRVSKK